MASYGLQAERLEGAGEGTNEGPRHPGEVQPGNVEGEFLDIGYHRVSIGTLAMQSVSLL